MTRLAIILMAAIGWGVFVLPILTIVWSHIPDIPGIELSLTVTKWTSTIIWSIFVGVNVNKKRR